MVLPVEVRAKVCIENSKLMEREFCVGTQWTQHGIVSFGAASGCEAGLPAGYTRSFENVPSKYHKEVILKATGQKPTWTGS